MCRFFDFAMPRSAWIFEYAKFNNNTVKFVETASLDHGSVLDVRHQN